MTTRSKYRNTPTVADGYRFDSKREAARWLELRAAERAGLVRALRRQVPFTIHVGGAALCSYRADFFYEERADGGAWREVVEDAKGARTAMYRLKAKALRLEYGIKIRET